MSGFPSLQPAFTVYRSPVSCCRIPNRRDVQRGHSDGSSECISTCTPRVRLLTPSTLQPITTGQLISEPGFNTPVDAELVFGSDYVRMETSLSHVRINVNAVMKDKTSGAYCCAHPRAILGILFASRSDIIEPRIGRPLGPGGSWSNRLSYVNQEYVP
ncbi:hypothetical protein BJX62DRAFT_211377 [Aspergillus germanicus]